MAAQPRSQATRLRRRVGGAKSAKFGYNDIVESCQVGGRLKPSLVRPPFCEVERINSKVQRFCKKGEMLNEENSGQNKFAKRRIVNELMAR